MDADATYKMGDVLYTYDELCDAIEADSYRAPSSTSPGPMVPDAVRHEVGDELAVADHRGGLQSARILGRPCLD